MIEYDRKEEFTLEDISVHGFSEAILVLLGQVLVIHASSLD